MSAISDASGPGGAATAEAVRVMIVDDHAIVREGLRTLLSEEPGLEVVGEASDGAEAVAQAQALRPDVILMDLVMPGTDGIEAIRRIVARQPGARIVVVTSFSTNDKVFPAIRAGALSYLLKDSEPEDLVRAIRQAHRGEPALHPAIAKSVLRELGGPKKRPPTADPLTARELAVLKHVAAGLSNQQIADALSVSEATIRTHVSSILAKLQVPDRRQAMLRARHEA